jgi:hypothetical protein
MAKTVRASPVTGTSNESDRDLPATRKKSSAQLRPAMTGRRRPLYSQLHTSHVFVAHRLVSRVFVTGSWMMPRLPVNMPRWEMATISPKGVTRF